MNINAPESRLSQYLATVPNQPDRSTWAFVSELKEPLWQSISWQERNALSSEADLRVGVGIALNFSDPDDLLKTATDDLIAFLKMGGVATSGAYKITCLIDEGLEPESFRITVEDQQSLIVAGDIEGTRRAIFHLEELILRAGGPFLPLGVCERTSVVRTRISRCFFGPTRRPPENRDELMDDIDYYPNEYLNRLAHEGVNGLWLTAHFDEVCCSSVLPEHGQDPTRRIAKLKKTVDQCRRYGIKVYLFANEPRPLPRESPLLEAHPELQGGDIPFSEPVFFCTSSDTAQAFLEEALYNLFSDVPLLGGLINITVGENLSHCYSYSLSFPCNCVRCADKSHHEVLNTMLAAMERGMHRASQHGELISWPYFQFELWGDAQTVESAGKLPKNVILQHNFESSGEVEQCGHVYKIADYWLSWPGPSQLFADCAKAARANGTRIGAKLQVGCSHEVATVPYVPVPGILYEKYRSMHDLGVSSVMQCWYFGNYPGVMTKAAGLLAFAPLPATKEAFLLELAVSDWGADAGAMVEAWKLFEAGYRSFPFNHVFGWFGPLHDAPVWPLYLEPVDLGISQSWLLENPSGDRYGEVFAFTHTSEEVSGLIDQMDGNWKKGVAILDELSSRYRDSPERIRDIGIASALGIQIASTRAMLSFYAMRESLPELSKEDKLAKVAAMQEIVRAELIRDEELIALCEGDPRLGFHSEAEGYKYYPEKIRWRMGQLRHLLEIQFPELLAVIENDGPLWPSYTGQEPQGRCYSAKNETSETAAISEFLEFTEFLDCGAAVVDRFPCQIENPSTSWGACYDESAFVFSVECQNLVAPAGLALLDDRILISIEPRRMWPRLRFEIERTAGAALLRYPARDTKEWTCQLQSTADGWRFNLRIPYSCLVEHHWPQRPVRLNVERRIHTSSGTVVQSWLEKHPLRQRLVFADTNPADLAWLLPVSLQKEGLD